MKRRIATASATALVALVCALLLAPDAYAHDPKKTKKLPPTKATPELKAAREKLDAAKEALTLEGKYACCTAPTCDTCVRQNGSCRCAINVAEGKGVCGECYAGWQSGRGSLKGVTQEEIKLSGSKTHASCHGPDATSDEDAPPEVRESRELLNKAKRIMVSEGRFSCCSGNGGCDECAFEGECACGAELAALLNEKPDGAADAPKDGEVRISKEGVCGSCLDGWHSGQGMFRGVAASEVPLVDMLALMMESPSGGPYRNHNAMGSGTSLLPASSPVDAWHFFAGSWMVMAHGTIRLGYNQQNGPRGVGKLESQNWIMLMGEREVGPGNLLLRGMFSAEPITTPHGGFPQLFQTGETYRGREIVDAQHPHDLFMELAASYTIPVGERASWQIYLGAVGEPALGPSAFMHRPSAAENPAAPLGHHWQDSSHITHGVVTTGLQFGKFKLEGSVFHGAEPDEERAGIEFGALDSWSARVWYTPTRDWALQVSAGRLNNPEALEPGDLTRVTASIHHNKELPRGFIASSLIWGRNAELHGDSNSYLFESNYRFLDRNTIYTRLELVDKPHLVDENIFGRAGLISSFAVGAEPLGLAKRHDPLPPSPTMPEVEVDEFEPTFRIGAYTLGYVRDVYENRWVNVGVGGDVTVYSKPSALDAVYGNRPTAVHFFVRVRPSAVRH